MCQPKSPAHSSHWVGVCTALPGVVLTNSASGPPTGSFPAEMSQPLPRDQSGIDHGKHRPHPEPLSLSQLCQHRTLCSWGPEAELALPPDRWMTSPRVTPSRHQDGPRGGLRLLLGPLPTLAPWLTSAERQSTGRGGAHATPLSRWLTLGKTEPPFSCTLNGNTWPVYTPLTGKLTEKGAKKTEDDFTEWTHPALSHLWALDQHPHVTSASGLHPHRPVLPSGTFYHSGNDLQPEQPHVAAEHLKCGCYKGENSTFTFSSLKFINSHTWLGAIISDSIVLDAPATLTPWGVTQKEPAGNSQAGFGLSIGGGTFLSLTG